MGWFVYIGLGQLEASIGWVRTEQAWWVRAIAGVDILVLEACGIGPCR
jgi:hypothetical protein